LDNIQSTIDMTEDAANDLSENLKTEMEAITDFIDNWE